MILLFFSALLLLISWTLPIHHKPWLTAYPELLAALALCLAVLGVVYQYGKSARLPKAAMFIALLACVPLLQFANGTIFFAADAWLSAGFLLMLAASVLVGFNLQLQEQEDTLIRYSIGFAWLVLTAALISSLLATLQWLGLADSIWIHPLKPGARPYANIAQPNNLATLLGFGLASLIYLFEKKRVPSLIAVSCALFILLALALAQSRTTLVAALFIIIFWHFQSRRIHFRLTSWHIIGWVAAFAVISLTLPIVSELLGSTQRSITERVQANARIDMYLNFIEAIKHSPWFGYGWNQAITAQLAVADTFQPKEVTLYTHNVFLDLLIWNGPLLGSAIIVVLVAWFSRLLMRATSLTATFCWLALSFFIIHSLFEFPHAYTFLLLPAGVLLGMLVAETQQVNSVPHIDGMLLSALALIFFSATLWIWSEYTNIEEEHWTAVSLLPGQEVPSEHTERLNNILLLKHLSAYTKFISLPIQGNLEQKQLQEILAVSQRWPYFYSLLKSSYLLALNGETNKAYEQLLALRNMHGEPRFNEAITYLTSKQKEHPELAELLDKIMHSQG